MRFDAIKYQRGGSTTAVSPLRRRLFLISNFQIEQTKSSTVAGAVSGLSDQPHLSAFPIITGKSQRRQWKKKTKNSYYELPVVARNFSTYDRIDPRYEWQRFLTTSWMWRWPLQKRPKSACNNMVQIQFKSVELPHYLLRIILLVGWKKSMLNLRWVNF